MFLASYSKAIFGGLSAVLVNLLAQPQINSAWHVLWTSVLAYAMAHGLVFLSPANE